MNSKKIIVGLVALVIIAGVAYFLTKGGASQVPEQQSSEQPSTLPPTPTPPEEVASSTQPAEQPAQAEPTSVLGTSVGERAITAYHFGTGDTELLFVGGIHGGYSWNTALVAYELVDYLTKHPEAVPANERVTVIPVLNPDGLYKVTGKDGVFTAADVPAAADTVAGRFNGNTVDLNRNFDCDWQAKGVWQTKQVSGGGAAFSEPESQAIKSYIDAHTPAAVVVYYSSAGGVFSSNCHNGVLPETAALTKLYADASGYKAYENFDYYEITGDMVNWLAKEGIPAISVLLTNHTDTEWNKNLAGVQAVLEKYKQ